MDLKTHIKNHQILWGSGIGFVIFVSFIGGMILVNTKPWEREESVSSSDTISSENERSDHSSSGANFETLSSQQHPVVGTITKINGSEITVSPINNKQSQTFEVPPNTDITLIIQPPESLETQKESLSVEDLRTDDTVNVYTQNNTVQRIKVITNTSPQEPETFE